MPGQHRGLRCVPCVSPQVFREQAIDGETLPLLTEEHLLNNMGLKLGPALKIRSQVGKSPLSEQGAPFKAVPGAVQKCGLLNIIY